MGSERGDVDVMPTEECLDLLRTARTGRVAFSVDALPRILPVAFAMDGTTVVIRVPPGSPLDSGTRNAVVAFEVDEVDDNGSGWSVSVTGLTSDIADPGELARARDLLGDDSGDRFVRISLDLVSGRRGRVTGARVPPAAEDPPSAAAGPPGIAETHSGVVFFLGDRAYKLKKPVDLGFLDFRTRQARLAVCRREVALNRRLAPDVYLGVADVLGPDGRPCDHLVVMRRMPEDRRLSSLVSSGAPVSEHVAQLARLLARFHASATRSAAVDEAASRDADADRWKANAEEMARYAGAVLDPDVLAEVAGLARRFIAGRGALFDRRIADKRAVDGHGDLLADDIFCLDDGPRVLDCLEFDDRLRYGDVLADVAFLAMDLERLGRPDLAASLLDAYRSAAGDSWPPSLADHYIAYRAQVRAKVACVRWAQGDKGSKASASRLLGLSLDHLRRARVRLVLLGGLPGTGKSTVARGLADALGARLVRSDEVRKELAGLDPLVHAPAGLDEGLYSRDATDATYTELLARARHALGLGQTVVLDATWQQPGWRRAAARLAAETCSDRVELRCVVPLEVAVDRVERRSTEGPDPSDATDDVVLALAGRDTPWPTATDVDTSGDPAAAVAAALAHVRGSGQGGKPLRRGDFDSTEWGPTV